jgi:hypothetical protein
VTEKDRWTELASIAFAVRKDKRTELVLASTEFVVGEAINLDFEFAVMAFVAGKRSRRRLIEMIEIDGIWPRRTQ